MRSGRDILNVDGVISNIQGGTLAINSQNIYNSRNAATKIKTVTLEQIRIIPATPQEYSFRKSSQRRIKEPIYLEPDEEFNHKRYGIYDRINEAIYLEKLQLWSCR